ncbi:hypothetical protein CONPUDRAFT_141135 [Coniophora puteana RWD-64-598 SS2]|uniref:Uncharacterized protein n=1 Tax=Coniophora puteana (strain RWD-64-598) TaxID=741705 RepID=A0A5M3N5L7_CONPW|nr:uncharacterized protein CONPUDRAFT_141135 [Coniophora puteana RWD-64-598 SS2]EIW86699.1 hypothetical protein CONPUDRAFT_141135 [Coniophora puteana RWD-64-598 SS2]
MQNHFSNLTHPTGHSGFTLPPIRTVQDVPLPAPRPPTPFTVPEPYMHAGGINRDSDWELPGAPAIGSFQDPFAGDAGGAATLGSPIDIPEGPPLRRMPSTASHMSVSSLPDLEGKCVPATFMDNRNHPGSRVETQESDINVWAQSVAQTRQLTPDQVADVTSILRIGKDLGYEGLRLYIWLITLVYQVLNNVNNVTRTVDFESLHATLLHLNERMDSAYQLSKDQKRALRKLAQDLITSPGRMEYMDLAAAVVSRVRTDANAYGFTGVINTSAGDSAMVAEAAVAASAARNRLRAMIVDSMESNKKLSLEDLTFLITKKLKKGGAANVRVEHLLHFAVLRYHAKRRRETAGGVAPPGRVKRGADFWTTMDHGLGENKNAYGDDIKDNRWKVFYRTVIAEDQQLYGRNRGNTHLPAIPVTYLSPAPVRAPRDVLSAPSGFINSAAPQPVQAVRSLLDG